MTEPPAEAPKPQAPVRDIKLQLNGPDQRVELRMMERGGDIRVAVRTPDSQLAGALRQDLPALSARLEQTGFRAETWHTGESSGAPRLRTAETAAAGTSTQDREQQQHGRQDPEDPRQQHQNSSPQQRKDNRKDFAWLFTSLR